MCLFFVWLNVETLSDFILKEEAEERKEHDPSHIHALYGEYVGVFDLHTMVMTEGDLSGKLSPL